PRPTLFPYTTLFRSAAFTSASESVRLPPLGGIAPLPLSAFSYTCSAPCTRCIAHAFLSPSLGAFATPAPWQAMHVDSYTFLPSVLAAACTAVPGGAGSRKFPP